MLGNYFKLTTNQKKGGPMVSLKVFNSVGKELPRIEQAYDNRFFQSHCLRSPALALACSG